MTASTYANSAALSSGDGRTQDRLIKLLGMLGSGHAGERAAAAAKADSLLRSLGLRWCDVISIPLAPNMPPGRNAWTRLASYCLERAEHLNEKERLFCETMSKWSGEPSAKQQDWLVNIYNRLADVGG
jgi:hypothetical protein